MDEVVVVLANEVVTGTTVVVVGGVVVVVVVVGVDPTSATAITGEALSALGALATMPVAALLFGYGVHVNVRVLPDTLSDNPTAGSTVRLMAPPVAVNGPTDPGVEGRTSERPVDGTGLGMGASMEMGAAGSLAGVASVASTASEAMPAMAEFPSAAAADTMELGSDTVDW
jgi:hypothetical protein